MPTPIENVTAFFAAYPKDGGRVAIQQWFTPSTVWVNEGVATTTGIDEAIAFIDALEKTSLIATVRFEMLAIAADGNRVLTERLDRFERADGSEIGAAKVMGILEFDGDHITAWRDYFDVNLAHKISDS
ncbi:limonene-1,2-epoxide hydrolase family protein [Pseudomonas cyclaminis]|uniref:limonene-1,2-epoxide hydrolase family protein n=1 Tax=Pseudomonas cyclaminis TaxID=2781239 RepID=UPI0038097B28